MTLGVMSRRSGNERAEGLLVTFVTNPFGDLQVWHLFGATQSLAGSMRPIVVARESDLCWRRTDDERSGCVLTQPSVRPRFCVCGYYELCGYTDESSAARTIPRLFKSRDEVTSFAAFVRRVERGIVRYRDKPRICNGFVGLSVTIPHS